MQGVVRHGRSMGLRVDGWYYHSFYVLSRKWAPTRLMGSLQLFQSGKGKGWQKMKISAHIYKPNKAARAIGWGVDVTEVRRKEVYNTRAAR